MAQLRLWCHLQKSSTYYKYNIDALTLQIPTQTVPAGSFGVRATLKVPRGSLANGRQIHRLRIPKMKKARHDSNECKLHLRLAPSPVSIVLTKALLQSVVFQGATRAIDSFLDVYLSAKVALRTLMLVFDNGRRHRRARRSLDNHVAVVWHARLLAAGGTCGSNSLPSTHYINRKVN